ncbi:MULTISPECIES: hypothetical protein [Arenibacter]|uniref:hypothetical protein n=1 Tax=Arenibacter TaxID=178469 RepID=UPI00068E0305|nr:MULTISPECIES: hypothetical protein [Arenibacter]GBF19438.1 hypothetical protein C21_01603 [Arenibacter sp. NBRC 103722]
MKLLNQLIGLAVLSVFTLISCSKDESGSDFGKLALSAKSTTTATSSSKQATSSKSVAEGIEVTDFMINLVEFELELDVEELEMENESNEDWDDDGAFDFEDEIELDGPFTLDLMAGQISFLNVTVPNGNYEELEFKINKNNDENSEMFGKSVLIRGTVNDVPFVFWHNFMDEVEVDFEDPTVDVSIAGNTESLVIDFNLSILFNTVDGIDLSQATDNNNDGTIEISPSDEDGNNDLAQVMRNRMKDIIDLIDD